jgi:hypothetical protein
LTLRDNYLTLDDMSYIRSAGLRGFAGLVAEHGGDAEAMARRARLPVQALHDDELLVEDVALARVLELAAAELDLPDLGLRLAERQDLAMLGPLAVAIQNSPTLGDALACSARYLFVHARGRCATGRRPATSSGRARTWAWGSCTGRSARCTAAGTACAASSSRTGRSPRSRATRSGSAHPCGSARPRRCCASRPAS